MQKSSTALIPVARLTALSVSALVLLCMIWESVGAPIKPLSSGFPWLTLKVVPLLPLIPRLLRAERRAFQILSLLILLYSTEGWVRAFSDPQNSSRIFAGLEIVLSTIIFIQANWFARKTRPVPAPASDANDKLATNAIKKERKPRPGAKSQLLMYVYATLLCLVGMSYLYKPDGSESARFHQIVFITRLLFVLLNIALIGYWLVNAHRRTKSAALRDVENQTKNNHSDEH